MRIGDLVKVKECKQLDVLHPLYEVCQCFFCASGSNRIGVVTGPAPRNQWHIMFDTGAWRLDDFDEAQGTVKVISESR
ncbi:hypothetical protein OAA09_01035 [bacterium]|nr:hypothetical protein [bacterium]